jgi:hypothetical protein
MFTAIPQGVDKRSLMLTFFAPFGVAPPDLRLASPRNGNADAADLNSNSADEPVVVTIALSAFIAVQDLRHLR